MAVDSMMSLGVNVQSLKSSFFFSYKRLKMSFVIPTVFSRDKKQFGYRWKKVKTLTEQTHIDVMDGKFVSGRSIALKSMPSFRRFSGVVEIHLMVSRPEEYFEEVKKKGAVQVIVHIESLRGSKRTEEVIHRAAVSGLGVFLALHAETPVQRILPWLDEIDGVSFMGIHAGKEGQGFRKSVLEKIEAVRGLAPGLMLQVDGGVDEESAFLIGLSGADAICSGSFVGDADDPAGAVKVLEEAFEEGRRERKRRH
jgi:ribulose-phosphate 3-epimerase